MPNKVSFETYKKRLRNITRFKDLPEEEFNKVAQDLYIKKYSEKQVDNKIFVENEVGIWLNEEEARQAQKIFNDYLKNRNFTDVSDIALLKNLVNYEIQLIRIQVSINKEAQKQIERGKNVDVPVVELRIMNEINTQILTLKRTLGLSEEKKEINPFEKLDVLDRKIKVWGREMYQASRFRECPWCSKPLLLVMRPEVWEAYKHPFWRDKYFFNQHLWDLYKEGKITSLDVAKVLLGKDVEVDYYIKWLEKKIFPAENIISESGNSLKESGQ